MVFNETSTYAFPRNFWTTFKTSSVRDVSNTVADLAATTPSAVSSQRQRQRGGTAQRMPRGQVVC